MFKFIKVALLKGVSSIGGLVFIYLVSYYYGMAKVAELSILLSISLGISLFSRLGWDILSIKTLAYRFHSKMYEEARGIIGFFYLRTVALLCISNILVFIAWGEASVLILSILVTNCVFGASILKSSMHPHLSIIGEPGALLLGASLLIILDNNTNLHIEVIDSVLLSGFILNVLIIVCLYLKVGLGKLVANNVDFKEENKQSIWYFMIALNGYFANQGIIWISDSYGSKEIVAEIAIIIKLAVFVTFPLIVSNVIYNPKFSVEIENNDFAKLRSLFYESLRIISILTLPVCVVMVIFSSEILTLFNVDSELASIYLRLFCCSQLVNVLTGNAASVLNLSGNQNIVFIVQISSLLLSLLLSYMLSSYFGGYSVLISFSLTIALQNLVLLFYSLNYLNGNSRKTS